MLDRAIKLMAAAGVAFCGFAGGSPVAIAFGALALAALRIDAQHAFLNRHAPVLGRGRAWTSIVLASGARAALVSGGAFFAGRLTEALAA